MRIKKILLELSSQFKDDNSDEPYSREERKLIQQLKFVLTDGLEEVEESMEMDLSDDNMNYVEENENETEEEKRQHDKYALDQMKEICERYYGYGRFQNHQDIVKTIRKIGGFSKLTDANEVNQLKKYVDQGGTKLHKLNEVKKQMFEKFKDARSRILSVHDVDLARWALEIADSMGLTREEFKASDSFVTRFKKDSEYQHAK
jgi:bisphosphoglycerate-independent phosphoglycerate mutase (AlkP superfamily)